MRLLVMVFVTFTLLAAGCETTSSPPSTQVAPETTVTTAATTASTVGSGPVSSPPAVGDLESVDDCFGVGIQALGTTCGYVTVPLDYDEPDAGTIRIATLFVDNGAGDEPPLMFFPGGPERALLTNDCRSMGNHSMCFSWTNAVSVHLNRR